MLRQIGCVLLLAGGLMAQQSVFAKYMGGGSLPDVLELPTNPSFISTVSAMYLDDIQTLNPPDQVKGRLAEQVLTTARFGSDWIKNPQPPTLHPFMKLTIKYDSDGREIERSEESADLDTWRQITRHFENGRLLSETGTSGRKNGTNTQGWMRLSYESERVAEITKGHGDDLENHYLNFEYDPQGRVTQYEYREGKSDKKLEDFEFKYTADIVETDEVAPNGVVATQQIQRLDGKRRVTDVRYFDLKDGKLTLWYHASFRYDDRGRVTEQVSDDRELGEGDDYVPLPGRVVIRYDDQKLTRTQEFYEKDKLALRAVAQLDRDGEELSLQILDGNGKEKKYSAFVPDAATGKPAERAGKCAWEVDFDPHENWIERRLWFTPADGSPKILLRKYTRVLTYR